MKRLGLMFTLCLAVIAAYGQSREGFRRKYGEPISETFSVRPGIGVTVTYSSGQVKEMVISPQNTDLIKARGRLLSRDSVKVIIDELVPMSERGKHLISGFLNMACLPYNDCVGTSENYEKVTIYYNAGGEGGVHYVVVQWKE